MSYRPWRIRRTTAILVAGVVSAVSLLDLFSQPGYPQESRKGPSSRRAAASESELTRVRAEVIQKIKETRAGAEKLLALHETERLRIAELYEQRREQYYMGLIARNEVLQAEHNMLVHLASFPNALDLRRVMDGQRILSHEAARRSPKVAPELIEKWLAREQIYKKLIDETRNVGGLVGDGGSAAAEAANAVSRLRRVHVDEVTGPEPLRDLDKLFTRTDAKVAAIIERGVADRLYFTSVRMPGVVGETDHLVNPVRTRYVPITAPINTDLLAIVRQELRSPPMARPAPAGAHESRQELRESIDHRPERRGGPVP